MMWKTTLGRPLGKKYTLSQGIVAITYLLQKMDQWKKKKNHFEQYLRAVLHWAQTEPHGPAMNDFRQDLCFLTFFLTRTNQGASLVAQLVKNPLQCTRPGCDPWVGRFPGEGDSYPLQYSGLENSMDYTEKNHSL